MVLFLNPPFFPSYTQSPGSFICSYGCIDYSQTYISTLFLFGECHIHVFDSLFNNQEFAVILIFNVPRIYFWSFFKICLFLSYFSVMSTLSVSQNKNVRVTLDVLCFSFVFPHIQWITKSHVIYLQNAFNRNQTNILK